MFPQPGSSRSTLHAPRLFPLGLLMVAWLASTGSFAEAGADLKVAQRQFLSGNYSNSIVQARQALGDGQDSADWPLLLSQALLTTGQYPEALATITNALAQDRLSIRLRWQARQVFLANGRTDAARDITEEIIRLVSRHSEEYRDAANLVVFGQTALLGGADSKRVLDTLFEAARKADPASRDVYLASGNLALDKHDFALAARRFEEGLKQLPDEPDLHYGLARAYAPSDQALMLTELETALRHNSNHVASLLLLTDHRIDAEDYDGAAEFLDRIKAINPWEPEAWAYRAVLAHLQNQPEAEASAREAGLKYWPGNPRVDYLLGMKLSQNYRFTEGAARQRQALEFDETYLPAKAQLAQDLLRLGDEAEGWRLAQEVQKKDAYDVEAYNLTSLHDAMQKFATLTNQDFILRISRHEAAVYGTQVLGLLERARSNLCAKYSVTLTRPTVVEVFPEQKDFAVRTFGMPGNPGYLGVCFGNVVTANSPAAHPGMPVNWQDVLWHEFCHVVTLHKTRNKMPRWLSEGISVYEERQASRAWGERMNPGYREMILGDELTPVSQLSAAFLAPRSALHLQFAYYESSLVVEFFVEKFGLDQLKALLDDLGQGMEINAAIEKHTAPMATIESDFANYAHERAMNLAPGLDWEKPDESALSLGATNEFSPSEQATNFWIMTKRAEELARAKRWPELKAVAQKLIGLFPDFTGPDSAYRLLAAAHRELGETNEERQVLAQFAERDDKSLDSYRRLMELASDEHDWAAVAQNAQRYLAVDPLVALPHQFLAAASEQLGQFPVAISEYRSLLELDPPDPAEAHYDLARLLHRTGDPEAKRQVLQALEDAPRYRAAQRLLLEIEGDKNANEEYE